MLELRRMELPTTVKSSSRTHSIKLDKCKCIKGKGFTLAKQCPNLFHKYIKHQFTYGTVNSRFT